MMHQNWLIKHWSTKGSVMSCCSVNGRYPRCPLMLHEWNWTNCSSGILVSVLKLKSLADVSIGRTVVRKGAVRVLQKSIVCGALQTKHLEYKMLEWGWLFDSRASRNCTWHQVSAARHPGTHKDMIWVCAVAAGLFEFIILWIFCCEVGSVVLTHLLCIGAVHNLVQVSCYGSCSGSHHEVKTLWGPAMVHQSPVCRLTPHLFLESHMVWLDLAEDDGHDWFMVQMVMTAHYWQSTQSASPILRRWALAHVGVLRATDFPVCEPDILGVGFPRKGVKLMMVLGCAGSYVKLALPQLQ